MSCGWGKRQFLKEYEVLELCDNGLHVGLGKLVKLLKFRAP